MKVLIIHHLEETWAEGYKRFGYDLDKIRALFLAHLIDNDYDKIILTQLENWEPTNFHHDYVFVPDYYDFGYDDEEGYYCLADFVTHWEEYGYGWERDKEWHKKKDKGKTWAKGGNHSDIVMLDEWMHELKNDQVFISGAFDNECIEDLEIALTACKVKYQRIENLII